MKTPNLIKQYKDSVNAIVKAFCQKNYIKFDSIMWVDRESELLLIKDIYISLSDIVYDIKTEQPKGKMFEFHEYLNSQKGDVIWKSYKEYCNEFKNEPQETEPKCTLTNQQLTEKCKEWIDKLCESRGKDWVLQVPANHNADPDLLFCELIKRFNNLTT